MASDKETEAWLPSSLPGQPAQRTSKARRWITLGAIVAAAVLYLGSPFVSHSASTPACISRFLPSHQESLCPQVEALYPVKNEEIWNTLHSEINKDSFKEQAISWLGGAVRVP